MASANKKGFLYTIKDNIAKGDKMIWIVAVMLMLVSLVAIFSSTSSHAILHKTSRIDIFKGQALLVLGGLILLVAINAIPNVKYIRVLSRYGFLVSFILLVILFFGISFGPKFHAETRNEVSRAIYMFGFTLQVYEVVKVAMVMYLSWALSAYEQGAFVTTDRLGTLYPQAFGWMKTLRAQRWIYMYIPMITVTVLTFKGGTSSALLLCIVMGATLIIGGIKVREIILLAAMGAVGILLLAGVHIVSNGAAMSRMQTGFNRLGIELPYPDREKREEQKKKIAFRKMNPDELPKNSKEYREYHDKMLQKNSAEVAFVQGGRRIFGKGPGKSTQKYKVPLIFEDYMFSFLMEEYGMIGCIIVLILYSSLFARGTIIVRNCTKRYAKTCVGGLVFLITFQAMLHILINCNVGIVTGQTLPLISHGKSSFLCFTIAFGVILAISTMANKKIEKDRIEAQKALESDEIKSSVSDVESIDSLME